ncbi:MAG: sodium:solute symporter family protein [Azoarcus sp.]|jgi:Na+/proline symporter|nr:sodium:solute symporter family protein [Azoarcus sp.]
MLLKFVVAYLAVSIGIGLFASAKVHNARDYITAGRHLPMSVVLAMVFATWFGSETVLGNSGKFFENGVVGLISDPLGAGVCLMLFGLFLARPLYRMNLLTLGDFFRRRYSRSVELTLSICIVISYLGWVAAQITALGLVFHLLSGIDQSTGMVIGAGIVLLYTLLGGMWSVAVTTFVQMIVIVLGLLYVTWIATDMAGGVAPVIQHAVDNGKFNLFSISAHETFGWIAAFFTMALGSIPQQDVFQRVNSSGNERTAVWGTTLGGFSYILFGFIPIYLAYTAQLIDPAMVANIINDDPQKIMPKLVMDHMSLATQVIFFGALLSVIMSTASGTLLAPSVTFSENVLRDFIPSMTDKQFLWASRITVIVFTLLVTVYSLLQFQVHSSIHDMVENAYRITLAGAFVPLVAGIFWKRANLLGGTLSVSMGLSAWVVGEGLIYANVISDIVEPQMYGLIASALGMVLGVVIGNPPSRKLNLDAAQISDEHEHEQQQDGLKQA